jgi:hypothetical protein
MPDPTLNSFISLYVDMNRIVYSLLALYVRLEKEVFVFMGEETIAAIVKRGEVHERVIFCSTKQYGSILDEIEVQTQKLKIVALKIKDIVVIHRVNGSATPRGNVTISRCVNDIKGYVRDMRKAMDFFVEVLKVDHVDTAPGSIKDSPCGRLYVQCVDFDNVVRAVNAASGEMNTNWGYSVPLIEGKTIVAILCKIEEKKCIKLYNSLRKFKSWWGNFMKRYVHEGK